MEAAPEHIIARAERTLRDRVYGACYTGWHAIDLSIWEVDGEPVPFAQAADAQYEPAGGGTQWGTPWSTAWFRARGQVPQDWPADEVDLDVDLGWTWGPATGEALMYDTDGRPVEGMAPGRPRIPWPQRRIDVYIEAAANPMPTFDWYPTDSSLGPKPDSARRLTVSRAQFVRVDRQAERAAQDFVLAIAVVKELTDELQRVRALEALWAACNVVDDLAPDGQRWARVSEALSVVFDTPAGADAGHLHAVANAHIDTAWLWPFRETVRKVARSYANALSVMDDDPQLVFASSQVQHLAWMADLHPDLFERIRKRITEGRWIVEGGTWVEPDGNMPSGESFARQFLQGQTWLQENLGITATSFWLPDTFGYSAGLPQIARGAGCDTFITQKLSWNSVNVFPHTTLLWEGLDGSRLLTHFPPADDYNCSVQPHELAKAQRKMSTQPVSEGLFLYGFGDGGGGPTREMGQRLQRLGDVAGLPRITPSTVAQFFAAARATATDPPVWSGELYLEYHRGTLTSQAHIKQAHRRAEALLREAEIWATGAHLQQGWEYPADQLRDLWRELLVMQFHDVLPGTSIGWVHDEALRRLQDVGDAAQAIVAAALAALAGEGEQVLSASASPHPHPGVPALGSAPAIERAWAVDASEADGAITLSRGDQRVTFTDGLVTSFRIGDREVVPPDGAMGRLRLHPDRPVRWDAWDLDEQHIHGAIEIPVSGAELMPDATVVVTREWEGSTFTQHFRLRDEGLEIRTDVDWHAADVLLRMECDLDVLATSSYVETMYGFLKRPTTRNTSWERAKFETCGHRWLHLGETGFGVALLTPTTYGSRITRHHRDGTGVYMRAAFSLLRAPAFPDPRRDAGSHSFRHVVVPGVGAAETIALADRESFPVRTISGAAPFEPVVQVRGAGIAVEAVKLAEDGSRDVIVRLREVLGARSRAAVTLCVPATEVVECDLVERPHAAVDPQDLPFRQFEVKTLRVRR